MIWHHDRRYKHKQNMDTARHLVTMALIDAATSRAYSEKAQSAKNDSATEAIYRAASTKHAMMGWQEVCEAIDAVVECGCPRRLWPYVVQTMIPEPEDRNENSQDGESSSRLHVGTSSQAT